MNNIIKDISNSFILEALSSPRMLEDLAAMEKYMAESYDGRTFVELLQNADDAKSKRLNVSFIDNVLIVANDGRPFNEEDIISICRSGASNKTRGNNIGYRGVGFKSATSISTEIVIHSNNSYFTFSKTICAKILNKNSDSVPTVRIPFLYDDNELNSKVKVEINKLKIDGFTTFFIFVNPNMDKFLNEIKGFDTGWLIFLRNITNVNIACENHSKECSVTREIISNTDTLLNITNSKTKWYIISKNYVSIAFKYDLLDGIVPCKNEEAVFHCFLPTLDKTGFPFKVNADFSTDPSRKHIIQDESTECALNNVQDLLIEFIERIISNSEYKNYSVLSLLATYTTLNPLVIQFENGILNRLRTTSWIPLNNGQFESPANVRIYPKWINNEEGKIVFTKYFNISSKIVLSSFAEKVDNINILLNKLGAKEISVHEICPVLTNVNLVKNLTYELWGKIFVYCYRIMINNEDLIKSFYLPSADTGYIQLSQAFENSKLNTTFISTIKHMLNGKEIETLSINYNVFSFLQKKKYLDSQNIIHSNQMANKTKSVISKWKTPIQNCMTLETINGHTVTDVSRKCTEYCVISKDEKGLETYITVKTVGILGDSFKLSENEYSAALRFGDRYKVYLFTTNTSELKYSVITNPIDNINMNKVVKEWEWLCNSNESIDDSLKEDKIKFENTINSIFIEQEFDNMDGQQFERFCAQILIKNGYEDVSLTKVSGDQGVDIIAYKDKIKFGIQCKCYSSDVGNDAVQEVFSGKTFYKCNIAIVLTNQHFTPSAVQLAENNGVVLWGRENLLKLIRNIK